MGKGGHKGSGLKSFGFCFILIFLVGEYQFERERGAEGKARVGETRGVGAGDAIHKETTK